MTKRLCSVIARSALVLQSHAAMLWVSPSGSDNNPGTKTEPFRTIEHARDAVRNLKTKSGDKEIIVNLRGGTYRLARTLVFSMEDSAGEAGRIIYQAAPGETPVLSSAFPITGWKKAEKLPDGFPAVARDHIWVADVPTHPGTGGVWTFKTLYGGEKRLPRARGEGFAPTRETPTGMTLAINYTDMDVLEFPKGAVKDWDNLQDVEIYVLPGHQWVVNYLPLKSVDTSAGRAVTTVPATYAMARVHRPAKHYIPETVWVENVPEALDEPGEWVLNSTEGKLYFWPENEAQLQSVCAPTLTELIRVEGTVQYDAPNDIPLKNLTFKGLTFTEGDRVSLTPESKGIQHDWDMYDAGNALLRFRGVEGCVVESCTFMRTGGTALRFDLYAQHNVVKDSTFSDIGLTGILLSGYGPGTKDVNKFNRIVNNEVIRPGEVYWHGIGIYVSQSGENEILNNRVFDTPYNGVVFSGVRDRFFPSVKGENALYEFSDGYAHPKDRREWCSTVRWDEVGEPKIFSDLFAFNHTRNNLFQDNEVGNNVQRIGDGNGLYISATGVGNVFRRNLIYNTGGSSVRCDDDQFGATLVDNITYGFGGFRIKHANTVSNNIAIPSGGPCITWGALRAGDDEVAKSIGFDPVIERNILINKNVRGNGDSRILTDGNSRRAGVRYPSRDNILWGVDADAVRAGLDKLQKKGVDTGSIVADPLFVDMDNYDFRLKPDSPALKKGFRPFDTSKIGLLDNPAFDRIRREGFPPPITIYWNAKARSWFLPLSAEKSKAPQAPGASKAPNAKTIKEQQMKSAAVEWMPASGITGDSDVSTAGTLVCAWSAASAGDVTVNGVTFAGGGGKSGDTADNIDATFDRENSKAFASSAAPYAGLSTGYQALLKSSVYSVDDRSAHITLKNLTPGKKYQVQLWVNDSRVGTRTQTVTSTGDNTVSMDFNTSDALGGLGQVVLGAFTAKSDAQTVTFTGDGSTPPQLNAVQVRALP